MSDLHSTVRLAEDIRQAFASGDRPLGERLLLAALDAGLAWDAATRAAAAGEATFQSRRVASPNRGGGAPG
jgi:hypothetical protein